MKSRMSNKDEITTNGLLQEVAELSEQLNQIRKVAKGERANENELEQLSLTVKYQNKEMAAARERMKGLVSTREVLQQLIRSTNNDYRVYSTGGSLEEMSKVFEQVDELVAGMSIDEKSQSSSFMASDDMIKQEEDDGGGAPDDDPGGTWERSVDLWLINSNSNSSSGRDMKSPTRKKVKAGPVRLIF